MEAVVRIYFLTVENFHMIDKLFLHDMCCEKTPAHALMLAGPGDRLFRITVEEVTNVTKG